MIEMFKNSKFAPTEIINQGLKEIEARRKNIAKTCDIKALRKEIVESYKKILVEARKKLEVATVQPELKLTIRELQAGKSTLYAQKNNLLPANSIFDYNNQLVGVEYSSSQFKFVMSSGEKSDVPWSGNAGALTRIEPAGSAIAKILVCYNKGCVTYGLKLFTKDGTCVLQVGIFNYETIEIAL